MDKPSWEHQKAQMWAAAFARAARLSVCNKHPSGDPDCWKCAKRLASVKSKQLGQQVGGGK